MMPNTAVMRRRQSRSSPVVKRFNVKFCVPTCHWFGRLGVEFDSQEMAQTASPRELSPRLMPRNSEVRVIPAVSSFSYQQNPVQPAFASSQYVSSYYAQPTTAFQAVPRRSVSHDVPDVPPPPGTRMVTREVPAASIRVVGERVVERTLPVQDMPPSMFPHYVPGHMPFDFLSQPLVPYPETGLANFRPSLGSLPAPRAPLRHSNAFHPSWTDVLVEDMRRDPTWDQRLSFVAVPPEPGALNTNMEKPKPIPDFRVGPKKVSQSWIHQDSAVSDHAPRKVSVDQPFRPLNPDKEPPARASPPTPRVLAASPKPQMMGALGDENDRERERERAGPKVSDMRADWAKNAGGQTPDGKQPPNNAPRTHPPLGPPKPPGGGTPVAHSAPKGLIGGGPKSGRKDIGKPTQAPDDMPKDVGSGGGLAARRAAYMQATKASS